MQIPSSVNFKLFINLNSDKKTERKSLYLGDEQRKPLENLWPKSSGQSGSSSRKAAAAAKIAELKMRLEAMLKFAGIGKGNPAAAISLAKELAAAVRAYGGSSGGDSAVSMPQLNLSANSATESNGAAAQTDSTAIAVGDATSSAAVAAAASTAASVTSATNNTKGGETSNASGDVKAASAAAAQTSTSPLVKLNSANGLSAADSKFLVEAKSLMQQIKMLIKLETKKAEDEKKAQTAINEMEKAIQDAPAAIAQSNLAESTTEYSATGDSINAASATSSVSISV